MLYTGGPFGMASRGQRSVSIDTEDVDIPQETKTAVTPVSSFLGIQDRSRWPDDALKRLAKGVDQDSIGAHRRQGPRMRNSQPWSSA